MYTFSNFLSTADNRDAARAFAESIMTSSNIYGILLKITINTSNRTVSFANVELLSNFTDESGILFSIRTLFCIGRIESFFYFDSTGKLWQVKLEF